MRDGIAEYGDNIKTLSLKDGKIKSDYIAAHRKHYDFDTDKTEEEYCKYVNGKMKK